MGIGRKLKICFVGGSQAGIVGLLTVLAQGNKVLSAVSYFDDLTTILKILKIPLYKSVNDKGFIKTSGNSDIILSVHGREILRADLLKLPKYGAVNLHPYLYKYKGANPVARALEDKEFKASVGAHIMTENIDEGRVLVEEFTDTTGSKSVGEIYNKLYPCYCSVILKALEIILYERHKK